MKKVKKQGYQFTEKAQEVYKAKEKKGKQRFWKNKYKGNSNRLIDDEQLAKEYKTQKDTGNQTEQSTESISRYVNEGNPNVQPGNI